MDKVLDSLKIAVVNSGVGNNNGWAFDKWKVEFTFDARSICIDYHTGIGHRDEEGRAVLPTNNDILFAVITDIATIERYSDKHDFIEDLGYKSLREGEKAYKGCLNIKKKLKYLLGTDFDEWFKRESERFTDY